MNKIPQRLPKSLKGLQSMIDYINSITPTKELTILEIGSWVGVSTELFAKAFKKVIAVDPWRKTTGINTKYDMREVEKEFDRRMKPYKNVIKVKKTSLDYKNEIVRNQSLDEYLENPFMIDVLYIDGAHDYKNVRMDLFLWKDRVTKFICGHDYYNKFPGVKRAVNEFFEKPDKTFPDTSWLIEVKK